MGWGRWFRARRGGDAAASTAAADRPAHDAPFEHLVPGWRYRVAEAFRDHDGIDHGVGEQWTFLRTSFLPYEDGRSLFVVDDSGTTRQIRLQDRAEAEASVLARLDRHLLPLARRPGEHAMLLTRDSVCLADDVYAPHAAPIAVPAAADARAVAKAILAAGYLAYTSSATWSFSLDGDRIVFGWRWLSRFCLPVGEAVFTKRADSVERLHIAYHAQSDPHEIAARMAGGR